MKYNWLSLALITFAGATQAHAAIISTNSLVSFQANGAAVQDVTDFDAAADGTVLGTLGDITFAETTGEILMMSSGQGDVLSNGATFGILSSPNVVNMENPGAGPNSIPFTESEQITLSFANPRQAVGLFVQFDRFNILNAGEISLTTGGASAIASQATAPSEDLPVADTAYFLGLYDDTGTNSISSVTLEAGNGTMRYVFDHVLTHQASAVPEPSGLLALSALGVAFVAVRRRKRSRQ